MTAIPAPDGNHAADWQRLQDILTLNSGFRLVFAAYSNIARDKLIAELAKNYRQTLVNAKNNPALPADLKAQAGQFELLHIIGTELWFTPDSSLQSIYHLNYQRESLAAACQQTVLVLWLYDSQISEFAHEAPDLWAWRKAVLDFSTPLEQIATLPIHLAWLDADKADIKDKQQRLENINSYLQGREVYSFADGQLWLEKSHILQVLGLWDESLVAAAQSLEISKKHQNKRAESIANSQIAYIFQMQGNLEQALTIYQQQVLPEFEALADKQQIAVTLLRIADIFQLRGDSAQALQKTQQALSLFEAMGDKLSATLTQGRIADIMHKRGELGQALQIYQQILSVFADLGNKSNYAVTKVKIADILSDTGELEQALQIYQHEALPALEALGDKYLCASTIERMAVILQMRGELTEALNLYQQKVLPIYAELGNKHGVLICQYNIAMLLEKVDRHLHQSEINSLLCQALQAAQAMRIAEAEMIMNTLTRLDMQCISK